MKHLKKYILGLAALVILLPLFMSAAPVKAASCTVSACSSADITAADSTYAFQGPTRITGTFRGKTVTFHRVPDLNDGYDFLAYKGTFCNGLMGYGGLHISSSDWQDATAGKPTTASVQIAYQDTSATGACINPDGLGNSHTVTVANNSNNGATINWWWNTDTLVSNDGQTTLSDISTKQDNRLYGQSGSCSGGDVILLDQAKGNTGTEYKLVSQNIGGMQDAHANKDLKKYFTSSGCFIASSNPVDIGGTYGKAGGPAGGGGSSNSNTCESASFTSFEWIICPAIRLMDKVANNFNDAVVGLLTFDVSKNMTPEVKSSWNVFKNIASAVLVIVMLLVVFSQAIGGGPLDAYTVRKMIPRIVAAVIIMQLSWIILIWTISLFNDLGIGVRDLISAPFGGYNNLKLDHLIAGIGLTGSITTLGLFSILIGAVAFSGLTLGGLFLLAGAVVIGIIIAFAVLMLRYIFIIMLVILFPVAILLWILPGTERYWKLWYDNFIKLMLLFPLIMALIYAGRIFAHIGTVTAGSSTTQAILATLVVYLGYFAPYFFLPQALKWGGQMYGAMAGGIWNATKGLRTSPSKYATDMAQQNRQTQKLERAARLADNKSRFRRWDELLAGKYNFARGSNVLGGGDARLRAYRGTISQGREEAEKSAGQMLVGSKFEQLAHSDPRATWDKLRVADVIAQGGDIPELGLSGKNPALQRHMLNQLAEWGDWDRITRMRTNGQIPEAVWQQFTAKNISAIHQQAPHLSPLGSKADLSQAGYEDYAGYKDEAFKEMGRQYFENKKRVTDPSDGRLGTLIDVAPEAREARRRAFAENARAALRDTQVSRRLTAANTADLQKIVNDYYGEGASSEETPPMEPGEVVPPQPPEGPGNEEDSGEIRIDR